MAAGLGFKTFNTGDVLSAADVNGYLMQGVLVFASATARDTAITSPQEGQFAYTKDNNSLWYYDGAAWVASGATGDIEGVTAGTGISGGGTSGTVTITNSMATAIDAKGDLVAGTGADAFARLAVGTNGQVLTADSAETTGLKWATAASGGGITLIQETVASGNSTLDFTSISSSYKQLLLTWHGIYTSASGTYWGIRFNSDSATNYYFNGVNADASAVATGNTGVNNAVDANNGYFFPYDITSSTDYGYHSKGYLLLDNYSSTSKNKWYFFTDSRRYVGAAKWQWTELHGTYNSTSAISSINIYRSSGSSTFSNATNTSIRLYGIS
jgi:hypothetical protein